MVCKLYRFTFETTSEYFFLIFWQIYVKNKTICGVKNAESASPRKTFKNTDKNRKLEKRLKI